MRSPISDEVRSVWGRGFRGLPEWPVLPEDVPRTPEAVRALVEAAPEGALELVQCQAGPAEFMPTLPTPRERGMLFDPRRVGEAAAGGRAFVLRVGNIAAWCPPAEAWCLRFAEWVAADVGSAAEPVIDVRAEVYLVAPHGITAFHADPSHNFTLQVRGRREIHAFSNADPRLVDDDTRSRIYLHRGRYPVYRAECEDRADRFELEPGKCCYLPPLTAHWLQNGDELSISYVISVRTRSEIREKLVHGMNARLRSVGYRPSVFGSHSRRDDLKAGCEQRIRGAGRWLERHVLRREAKPFLDPVYVSGELRA